MAVYRDARVAFTRGEVSEDLEWRTDLAANRQGLAAARNVLIRPQGGLRRRGGTQVMARVRNFATGARLAPFVVSGGDAVMVEWGAGYVRFHRPGGTVMDGADPHELTTPYSLTDCFALSPAQTGEIQWLFSAKRPMELRRVGFAPDRFELVAADFGLGPWLRENLDEASTIQASAATGSVTLTASRAIFSAAHVGALFRLDEADWSGTPQWVGQISVSTDDRVRYDGRVYRVVNGGTTSPNPPRHLEGRQADSTESGAVIWEFEHEGFGVVEITAVASATEATATVRSLLPHTVVSAATPRWREQAWSDRRGWPTVGAFYQRRLWAGGTTTRRFALYASAIQGFNDFAQGALDDEALSRDLIEGEANAIRWLAPGFVLTIGTDGAEWVARPASGSDTVTPKTLDTRSTTIERAGVAPGVQCDDRLLFTDASRRRLVAHFYDFATDAYTVDDLTVFSDHILAPGVTAMAWQKRPNRALWLLRADGKVASLTYDRRQEVAGWALHDFGGVVESIAVMPCENGEKDDLWLIVQRGNTRTIERLVTSWPHDTPGPATAWFLDGAVLHDGAPTDTVGGLGHFEGESLVAVADGEEISGLAVSFGAVTLPREASRIVVGKPFTSLIETLPFDLAQIGSSTHGRQHTVTSLSILMGPFVSGRISVGGGPEKALAPGGAGPDGAAPPVRSGAQRVDPPTSQGVNDRLRLRLVFDDAFFATFRGLVEERED